MSKELKSRGNIFFAIPTMPQVFSEWAFGMMRFLTDNWVDGDVITTRPPVLIHLARQEMLDIFLDETDCEWLMWIDDDVVPPMDAIDTLLKTGKQCISGLYHYKYEPYSPVWYRHPVWSKRKGMMTYEQIWNPPSDEVIEIASSGLGCMIVHRDVLKKIEQPAFALTEKAEDHGFTRRVREAGFKIYGHSGVQCTHLTTMGVTTGHWLALNAYMHSNPFFTNRPDLIKELSAFAGRDMTQEVRLWEEPDEPDPLLRYVDRDVSPDFAELCMSLVDVTDSNILIYGDPLGSVSKVLGTRGNKIKSLEPLLEFGSQRCTIEDNISDVKVGIVLDHPSNPNLIAHQLWDGLTWDSTVYFIMNHDHLVSQGFKIVKLPDERLGIATKEKNG